MDFRFKKIKLDTLQILTILFIVLFLVYNFWRLPYGLDTIWDDGFLLMNYQNPYLQGASQSYCIISKIFGNNIHDILYLRQSRYFLQLFTILLFSVASIFWIKNKFSKIPQNRQLSYFLLILLFGIGSLDLMNSSIISYNHLQQTFIIIAIAALLLFDISNKLWMQYFYLFIVGFFLLFAFLNIPPSGVTVGIIVGFILLFYKKQTFSKCIYNVLFLCLGIAVALCIYHLYFVNMYTLYNEMIITAKTSTKINDGHNIHTFLLLIGNYVKFYLFRIILFVVLSFMYFYFGKNKAIKVLSIILLIFILFIEPGYYMLIYPLIFATSYLLFSTLKKTTDKYFQLDAILFITACFVFVITIYAIIFKSSGFPIWGFIIIPTTIVYGFYYVLKKRIAIERHIIILLALFLLPLCSTIGTNISLLSKSIYFLPLWGLILVYLIEFIYIQYNALFIRFSIVIVIVILAFSFFQNHNNIRDLYGNESTSNQKYENLHAIKNIYIRPEQKQYFERVNNILNTYKYKKGDPFFCFQLDQMTMFVFEASSATKIFHQCIHFAADPIKQVNSKPKFLFLSKWDVQILNDTLKKMNWGFPEDFDKYYLGTPEIYKTNYPTERWLYCRKTSNYIKNDSLQ